MLNRLRSQLSPEFFTFIVVRLSGVATKPLVLLLAGLAMRDEFARDYALLISALASLFVLAGAQAHIDYYNRRFGEGRTGYSHLYLGYVRDSLIQYLLILPLVILLGLVWTRDPTILGALVLLVGIEKFFDEDQRHFQFERHYYGWCLSYGFRVILPSLAIIALLPFVAGPLIIIYTAFCLLSLIIYAGIRHRHFRFYVRILLNQLQGPHSSVGDKLKAFVRRWRQEYAFNQLWTFLSVNILLVDRLWVANHEGLRIDEYVFFANLFNLINVGHSLLYFVPRRPELIRKGGSNGWAELLRWPNLAVPFALSLISVFAAFAIWQIVPLYAAISPLLFAAFSLVYVLQAINLVGIEYVFWRVARKWLALCDGLLIVVIVAVLFLIRPPLEWTPFFSAAALLMRMLFYQWLLRAGTRIRPTSAVGRSVSGSSSTRE